MVFGEIVSVVLLSSLPVDFELALSHAIADPVETHVDCFGASLLDSVIDDSFCTGIVCLNWRGGLWVAKKFQGIANHAGFL